MRKSPQNQFVQPIHRISDSWYFSFVFPLYLLAGTAYFYWRVTLTMNWTFFLSWPLLLADLYTLVMTILFLGTSTRVIFPRHQPPLEGKSVDILIPTKSEPAEIVETTALAAQQVRGVNRVFILNDGARPEITAVARSLGVEEVSRQDNTHAKGGMMNLGLQHSTAEFVAFFDSDFVPQPEFIERTLGYFRDPRLAFVQTPQVFYNLTTSIQHRPSKRHKLWSEQTMFYDGIMPARNYHNAAIFVGTNALLRRSALDDIGGIATGTATEDIHTSLRLHARGWRSWYINEPLAFGLAPEDIEEYHRQRTRWGAGSLGLLLRSSDSPLVARGLTLMQRLSYISSNVFFSSGIVKAFYLATPILSLFTVKSPVTIPFLNFWLVFTPFFIFSLLVAHIHSRQTYHPVLTEQYNILNIFSNIAALKGVFKVQKKFGVSVKKKDTKQGWRIYYTLAGIMFVILAADWYAVFNWFYVKQGNFSGFISSDLAVAFFWNSLNLFHVWTMVHFLKRFYERDQKEAYVRPDSSISFDGLAYTLKDISLTRATLLLPSGVTIPEMIALPLAFQNQTHLLPCVFESSKVKPNPGTELVVRFDHLSFHQKKALTGFIFNRLVRQIYSKK